MVHRLATQAHAALDEIWTYIARESSSETIADRLIDSITNRFLLLASHPHLGGARDDELGHGRRSFPVSEYIIVYRVAGADVRIPARGARPPQSGGVVWPPGKGTALPPACFTGRHIRAHHPSQMENRR
jgi:plasmid stabilization system protein ParE